MVQRFIERQMLPKDNIAIIASSGRTGFLGQFMDDRTPLNAALERVIYSPLSGSDATPPISEFEAQSIERMDRDVTNVVVRRVMQATGMDRRAAETYVQTRARGILEYTRKISGTTLDTLEGTIREGSSFEGRKAIYFVSDGFLLDQEIRTRLTVWIA